MDRLRIVIAEDDIFVSSSLSTLLENLGHHVLGCASGGRDAELMTRSLSPDLVIMDIRMDNDKDGLTAAQRILRDTSLPIVILTAMSDSDLIEQADLIGVAGYILKPFSQNQLHSALTLAWSRFKQMQALHQEIGNLHETLKARKLIEQAKGLLMEREGLSESDAFRRIQVMSRNQNVAMVKLAEAIIMTEKLRSRANQKTRRTKCTLTAINHVR
jgi:two-component system, response regulator PdtaR